ncbi:hypothetical protein NV379_23325 [Paenibacillus sp. N1-5-1-14]|uniref:hypothetical protein n=1 Tax=Paenibacillus radicibacter TaxID=2972488 RepID=UPI0021593C86|nr:hypothetical protein [Paenibacillus radicibacter]MCR8645574.1 hypothetical protein [Paenibacillus radicibacter]
MITKPSGIRSVQSNDNAAIANFNRNDDILDFLLRPYRERIDTGSYDAATDKYTKVDFLRQEDGGVAVSCVLSNKDSNGNYLTDTWQLNMPSGVKTRVWTLVYDVNGKVVDKTYVDK